MCVCVTLIELKHFCKNSMLGKNGTDFSLRNTISKCLSEGKGFDYLDRHSECTHFMKFLKSNQKYSMYISLALQTSKSTKTCIKQQNRTYIHIHTYIHTYTYIHHISFFNINFFGNVERIGFKSTLDLFQITVHNSY